MTKHIWTPDERRERALQLVQQKAVTVKRLQALLPDCHPHDKPSVQEMIDSITNGMRWDVGELEAACRQAERSTRKDTSPVTTEEADRLRNELFDTRRSF